MKKFICELMKNTVCAFFFVMIIVLLGIFAFSPLFIHLIFHVSKLWLLMSFVTIPFALSFVLTIDQIAKEKETKHE